MARSRAWSLLSEGLVVVASILVAFSIDAWWENRQEREREAEALEVLVRDLESAEAQLADFQLFAQDKIDAAFEALRRLQAPVPPEGEIAVVDLLDRTMSRRTLALPRSGYTDLVTSGSLRVIRDPEIRDQILRFYQEAEWMERVVEKNSTQGTDDGILQALIPTGLIPPQRPQPALNEIVAEAKARLEAQLGPDFVEERARLWNYGPDSETWAGIRSLLDRMGTVEVNNSVIVDLVSEDARALRLEIIDYLDELGRPITPSGNGNRP